MKTTFSILTILFLTMVSRDAFACSCIGGISIKDEIKKSDAVFVGTIFDSEEVRIYDTLSSNKIVYRAEMKYSMIVETVYKGKRIKDITFIFTGSGGGDCGFRFKNGSKYIVYAIERDNEQIYLDNKKAFYTSICKRTRLFEKTEIKEIEKYLRKPKKKLDDSY